MTAKATSPSYVSVVFVLSLFTNAIVGSHSTAQCVPPPTGVVNWWPGDGNVNDIAGFSPATLRGGATFAAGKVGQAFSFSAVGHQVEVPSSANLNLESLSSATVEGWFKSSGGLDATGGDAVIVGKHVCGTATGWFFTTKQGAFIGNHHVGGIGVGAVNLNDGQFHHFAIVKDGSNYFEYVDGSLSSSDSGPAFGTSASAPVQIGTITTGSCFPSKHQLNGLVDELTIYHRALSPAEVQSIFNAGAAGKCKLSQSAVESLEILCLAVANLNLKQGRSNSLDKKLAIVLKALGDVNMNNDVAAINALYSFIATVHAQSGVEISVADADALIEQAERILGLLSS